MRKAALLSVLVLVTTLATAQETPTQYFGLGAGLTTGYGLSYRFWPGDLGLQVNAFPYVQKDTVFVSLGVTGLVKILDSQWSRFFGYFGGTGTYGSFYGGNRDYSGSAGGGVGFEFIAFDHITFNLQAGLRAYDDNYGNFGIGPTIEGGIYYRL